MKILQALHFPLEGAGTGYYVNNLSTYLTKKGHELGVVFTQVPSSTVKNVDYKLFPLDFQNSRLPFHFPVFESHPLSEGKHFANLTEEELKSYLAAVEENLDTAITSMKPDLVNVHHGWILGEMMSRKNIPYVITLHGTELTAFNKYPYLQQTALKGLQNAQKIIALNDSQREKAIKAYHLNPEKIITIHGGIDVDFYSPNVFDKEQILKEHSIELETESQPVILYVGRLTEIKGVEYLVEAATHYKENSHQKPKILLVGDGVLKEKLLELKRKYSLNNVHFLGHKQKEEVVKLYNVADLVVIPSLSEAWPLTPCEAMACGTPVIGTNIEGGLSYQITALENFIKLHADDIETGFSLKVVPENSFLLSEKIKLVLEKNLKSRLKEKISDFARSHFSITRLIDDTENQYSEVISSQVLHNE